MSDKYKRIERNNRAGRRNEDGRHRRKSYTWLFLIVFFVLIATLTLVLYFLFFKNNDGLEEGKVEADTTAEKITDNSTSPDVEAVELQSVVDKWVESVPYGNKSVLIYDLERDEVAAEYNTKESYSTASLYKLFVVYEGYRRLQSGEWVGEEQAGVTGYTISQCLDLAIRESHSVCAETLWGMIGRDELEQIIENDYKITDSDISNLISNPEDIAKMMKIFYEHKEISDEGLVMAMKDSFFNQPPTTYDWRQGLPSGFETANVYNKVGWDYDEGSGTWNIYHDAAIVEFPELNRHFIVVAMTNRVDYKKITELGKEIEQKVMEK